MDTMYESPMNTISAEQELERRNISLSHKDVATRQGLGLEAIRVWRRKHLSPSEYKSISHTRKAWTPGEVSIAMNSTLTNKDVADQIGRTISSVRKWRDRNMDIINKESLKMLRGSNMPKGVHGNTRKNRPLTISDLMIVAENKHLSTRELAGLIGRTQKSVYYIESKLRELGVLLK